MILYSVLKLKVITILTTMAQNTKYNSVIFLISVSFTLVIVVPLTSFVPKDFIFWLSVFLAQVQT